MLLDRLQLLGEGAREAGRRREVAEAGMRWEARERRAQVVSERQGQNIRCGFGLIG